jgi:myosin protein heavy chain
MQTESLLRAEVSKNSELTARIGQFNDSLQEASAKMMQHQQTISLLVSEKTALTTSLERLEELEPSLSHCLVRLRFF